MWLGGELVVAGPDTGPAPSGVPAGTEVAAVRFRPGAAPAVLGVPAAKLRDARVPLTDLWADGAELGRRVDDAAGPAERVAVLAGAVRERLPDAPPVDPVALAVATTLARPAPGEAGTVPEGRRDEPPRREAAGVVAALAEQAGLSERQLHRRCVAAFGYGPKTLDRVLRLQRFLVLGRAEPGAGLADLAVRAGYADQAHLAHDCRALAGTTPSRLGG
jgi:AraC-like DNA-binding protein